jgi:hypothetical protein
MQLLTRWEISIYNNRKCAFLCAGSCDSRTNAFRTASHQHDFAFELKIHGSQIVNS